MDNLTRQTELRQEELRARTGVEARKEKTGAAPLFRNLENWGLARGDEVQHKKDAFLKETIRKQNEYNMRLQETVQRTVPRQEVKGTASINRPPVQERAARESWKQRRVRQKKRELARKLCPVGDEITVDVSRAIVEMRKAQENSLSAAGVNDQKSKEAGVDIRILNAFCRGYRKNRKGDPASEEDETAKRDDMKFLKDYLSGEEGNRAPHLRRAADEILQMRFTPEMLTPEYVYKNIAEMIRMLDKITCIENMIKENPGFFENLPPLERDLIDANTKIAKHFYEYMTAMAISRGVGINRGNIYGEEYEPMIDVYRESLDSVREHFRKAIRAFNDDVEAALNREVDRKCEEYRPGMMLGYLQMEDRLRRERDPRAGIRFTSPTVTMTLRDNVYNVRKLIEENAENYLKNKDLIDKAYAEFFKCNDTMADLVFRMDVLQRGSDEFNQMKPGYRRELAHMFANRQEECLELHDVLYKRAEALKNIIEHCLTGTKLTPIAKEIMKEYI